MIHPREPPIEVAEQRLRDALESMWGDFEPTASERIQTVSRVLNHHTQSILKYCIRIERHGNAEDPGGLA